MKKAHDISLLYVEDEVNVGATVTEFLQDNYYDVTWVKNAEDARLEIDHRHFSVLLVDIGLPDENGFKVAEYLRDRSLSTAIVFLTAYSQPEDRIKGLSLDAEDYIVKPFTLEELLLRLKNAVRRAQYFNLQPGARSHVVIGRAEIDFSNLTASYNKKTVALTEREAHLLKFLYERRGRIASRDDILTHIWQGRIPTTRTIDNFILKLRKIVEPNPRVPCVIKSVRGVGYMLDEGI